MEQQDPQMDDREEDDDKVIMIRMDIKEPLNTVKLILEDQIEDIRDYNFTLQGGEEVEGSKPLLELCRQVEGTVQINITLKFEDTQNTIDILDILKPYDETMRPLADLVGPDSADLKLGRIQGSLDDSKGTNVTGEEIPREPTPEKKGRNPKPTAEGPKRSKAKRSVKGRQPTVKLTSKQLHTHPGSDVLQMNKPDPRYVQLWQFLLDLLTTHTHRSSIQWLEREGEFKIINPKKVARLWGIRKSKPSMNYDKMSRALRYYYNGHMLCKVPGKRFVYKFNCDLKMLIGYSSSQLNRFVIEAEEAATKREPASFSMESDFSLPLGSPPNSEVREGFVVPSDFSLSLGSPPNSEEVREGLVVPSDFPLPLGSPPNSEVREGFVVPSDFPLSLGSPPNSEEVREGLVVPSDFPLPLGSPPNSEEVREGLVMPSDFNWG